ncbi:MAG: hypothetical protein IPJ67_04070 [Candidatus Moraniibacteriota bacterium]|nr:MAG: hypothetical protein IPJ67_04070 [Candidatus Moranbacteria bacterium]
MKKKFLVFARSSRVKLEKVSRFYFTRHFGGVLVFGIFLVFVLAISLRGLPGNPTADVLNTNQWKQEGPLELSPERGRFALLYSVMEDHSFFFSLPVARFVTPDLGLTSDGRYASLFAPTVSLLVAPGYIAGRWLGASQVGAFSVIAVFALLNALLVRSIAIRLGARPSAASLGAIAFLFGTPAFAYGTTLYQHHVSVFLFLISLFLLLRSNGWWSLAGIWFCIALSVSVDNPNFFLLAPLGIFAFSRIVSVSAGEKLNFVVRPILIPTLLVLAVPMAGFLWYNATVNGGPTKLSGTLPAVTTISSDGQAMSRDLTDISIDSVDDGEAKSAVGFFQTRDLLRGFSSHLVSPDRGVIFYAPVILFGIFGLVSLARKKGEYGVANVFVATVAVNLLLYSMWGDPWGGWAFGSRYLIPSYAILGIGVGIALTEWRKNFFFLGLFFAFLAYSISVNALGAITSSANPPQHEVLAIEALSGKVEKYTAERNWDYLHENGSKSFVYQVWANRHMSADQYYWGIVSVLLFGAGIFFVGIVRESLLEKKRL